MPIQQICDYNLCTACFACSAICPKGAISQKLNALGEETPAIDTEKCVNCGLCASICPSNKKNKLIKAAYCYAAWSRLEEDLIKSSSGGIAAVLSRRVLNEGGIIYGAVCENASVFHMRIDTVGGIDLLRGSKYVKSDTRNTFKQVLNDLANGKTVLFFGTPCQVAGIKAITSKTQDNLITVDLVCHGTPPFVYLKEYLDHVCSGKSQNRWDSVTFRLKRLFFMQVYSKGKKVYEKSAGDDLYYLAFLDGMIFRSNCYKCQYARPERIGDLTIGDFWGIDREKINSDYDGKISLILPNTVKGSALLKKCENELNLVILPLEDALNPQQGNLLHPSVPHSERELFEKLYLKYGFVGAIKKTELGKKIIKKERKEAIKQSILYKVLRHFYHLIKEQCGKFKRVFRLHG